MVSQTAVFRAVGDFSQLRRESASTAAAMGSVDKAAATTFGTRLSKNLSARGAQMSTLGGTLTRRLALPLAAIGAVAVSSFAKFDKSITGAAAKTGATGREMEAMRKKAIDMGKATVFSAGEAAGALDQLGSLGFTAKNSMTALTGVMQAAQATGSDLALTTDTVARAMNAFGYEAKDAGKVSDMFAQAVNTTALDMQDLADGLALAGQVAPRYGQSLSGVIALMGRMVDMGTPAASAGAAITQAMTSLSAPVGRAKDVVKALGIETRTSSGELKQLPLLMKEMEGALDSSNPKMQAAAKAAGMTTKAYKDFALRAMFGVEGAKAVSMALSDAKPVMIDFSKTSDNMVKGTADYLRLASGLEKVLGKKAADAFLKAHTAGGKFKATGADAVIALAAMEEGSKGVAGAMAKIFGKTLSNKIDNMVGSWQTLAIALIEDAEPAIRFIVKQLTKLANWLETFSSKHDWFAPVVAGLVAIGIVIGPLLWLLGKLATAIGKSIRLGKRLGSIGRTKTPTTTAGGGGGGRAASSAVYWTRPMPVYLTGPSGGKPKPGAPGAPARTPASKPGRKSGPGRGPAAIPIMPGYAQPKPATKTYRSTPAPKPSRVRPAARVAGGAAGGGAIAGATTLAFGGSMKEAGKMVAIFAAIELAIHGVIKLAPLLGRAIAVAFTAGLGPIGLIIAGIALLITAIVLIVKNWDKVKAALVSVGNAFIGLYNAVIGPVLARIVEGMGNMLVFWGKMLQQIGKVPGMGWVGDLGDRLVEVGESAKDTADNIREIDKIKPGDSGLSKVGEDAKQSKKDVEDLFKLLTGGIPKPKDGGHPGAPTKAPADAMTKKVIDQMQQMKRLPVLTPKVDVSQIKKLSEMTGQSVQKLIRLGEVPPLRPKANPSEIANLHRISGMSYKELARLGMFKNIKPTANPESIKNLMRITGLSRAQLVKLGLVKAKPKVDVSSNAKSVTDRAKAYLASVKDRTVYLHIIRRLEGKTTHPGPVGETARGTKKHKGGWTWVGEEGPELIKLPRGAAVYPNPATVGARNMDWQALMSGSEAQKVSGTGQARLGLSGGAGARGSSGGQGKVDARSWTWIVHNPTAEKTSATTLKTLTRKAHGGING